MLRRWWWVGLIQLVSGCATCSGDGTTKAGQDEAVRIVWNEVFLQSDASPEIRWVHGTALICTDPNSGRPGFETPSGCREGLTIVPTMVQVAWRDDDKFSTTTLAHELLHALHFHTNVMADPNHKTSGFRPMSECPEKPHDLCGIVERANVKLVEAGL